MDKRFDDYSISMTGETDFLHELEDMEANSRWIDGVTSKGVHISSLGSPMFARDYADRHNMDSDLAWETAQNTQLLMTFAEDPDDKEYFVRDSAYSGLIYTVAGIGGSNVSKVSSENLATCANIFINDSNVKNKRILLLERYGKISGVHSDEDGGYAIMPIHELVSTAKSNMESCFGEVKFRKGYNSHSYTSALWTFPDAQEEIISAYMDILNELNVQSNFPITYMPGVEFTSSDTSNSCATLTPVFCTEHYYFPVVNGIQIRHTKRMSAENHGYYGMDLFKEKAKDVYTIFKKEVKEKIQALASILIYNGENCVVSLCKNYGIAQKYGDVAREMVAGFCSGGYPITAHDIYLAMTTIPYYAEQNNTPRRQVMTLRECIAKLPYANWHEFDRGGTVAWTK